MRMVALLSKRSTPCIRSLQAKGRFVCAQEDLVGMVIVLAPLFVIATERRNALV
jgi:hypothetical protein